MRKLLPLLLALLILPSARAAEADEKYIALTFDDGPSGKYTQTLLEGLEQRDAKATFFLCGYRLEQYPELAEELIRAGHEIGIHGYSHNSMKPMSRREIAKEISDTRALLPKECKIRLLRPPGGISSDGVRQVAEVTKLSIMDWSVDPQDWATQDAAAIGRSVLDRVQDGDVVLLHDMSASSVTAALNIIDRLKRQGFQFITVSELAELRGVRLNPGQTYRRFP